MRRRVVTVFGSSNAAPESDLYQRALGLGQVVARNGWTLCNGGYGGTMEAAARGAAEAGGHTIGVTCEALGRSGANRYIAQEVPTFDLFTRLTTLIRLGDAYVALPGGTGTLLEVAAAWEMQNKRLLRRPRAMVAYGPFWQPIEGPVRAMQPDALGWTIVNDESELEALLRGALNG